MPRMVNVYDERLMEKADELLNWLDKRYVGDPEYHKELLQVWSEDKETFRKYLKEIVQLAANASRL